MRTRSVVAAAAVAVAAAGLTFGAVQSASAAEGDTGFSVATDDTLVLRPVAGGGRTGTLDVEVTAREGNPELPVVRIIVRGLLPQLTPPAQCDVIDTLTFCDVTPPEPGTTENFPLEFRLVGDGFTQGRQPSVEVTSLVGLPQVPNDDSHFAFFDVELA